MASPLKFNSVSSSVLLLVIIFFLPNKGKTNELELTAYIGHMFSSELQSVDVEKRLNVSDDHHFGLAIAWQESKMGQGQILINYVDHQITDDQGTQDKLQLVYAHFSGVGHYGKRGYITTLGLGVGASYMKSSFDDGFYPSTTIAIGTRYFISKEFTFVTEIRAYATLIKEDDNIFCDNDQCLALFEGAIWVDTSISVGFAYKF